MKVEIIQKNIVNNYQKVMSMVKRKPAKQNIIPIYSLSYKTKCTEGVVSELGEVSRHSKFGGNIKMILKEGVIQNIQKPFYMTTKFACKKINNMLEKISKKVGTNAVQQTNVNVHTFSKELLEKYRHV